MTRTSAGDCHSGCSVRQAIKCFGCSEDVAAHQDAEQRQAAVLGSGRQLHGAVEQQHHVITRLALVEQGATSSYRFIVPRSSSSAQAERDSMDSGASCGHRSAGSGPQVACGTLRTSSLVWSGAMQGGQDPG